MGRIVGFLIRDRNEKISPEEVDRYIHVSPAFLKWMYEDQKVSGDGVVFLAVLEYSRGSGDASIESLALLLSDEVDEAGAVLQRVPRSQVDEELFTEMLLYAEVSVLYRERGRFRYPLRELEAIYTRYGYPPQISHLIRYMPSSGESASEEDLYTKWYEWIVETPRASERYGGAWVRCGPWASAGPSAVPDRVGEDARRGHPEHLNRHDDPR